MRLSKVRNAHATAVTRMQVTPDLLAEAGYRYVMDFGQMDDQPIWIHTRSGKKLLVIPYAQVRSCFAGIDGMHCGNLHCHGELVVTRHRPFSLSMTSD